MLLLAWATWAAWAPVASALAYRGGSNFSAAAGLGLRRPECSCEANSANWKRPQRTEPRCVFIDLGAADGNTFDSFLANGYGPVKNCPRHGEWQAILVEANPMFTEKLQALQENLPEKVQSLAGTAAYSCETTTSFSIDPDSVHNYWGSSLVENVGLRQVTVPTINVNKLLLESVIPEDWVMLKIDIEGAEYDVMPCLAEFKEAELVDEIFLEEHWLFPDRTREQNATMVKAKEKLRSRNVRIPAYFSNS